MGLLNFKKPKWHHKNPAVRLAAITTIDLLATEVLADLCLEDQDQQVRRAAINRLTDLTTLDRLARGVDPQDLPFITTRKDQLLYERVVAGLNPDDWRDDLAQISSAQLLAKLAVNDTSPEIRLAAVGRIDDQHLLADIVEENCGKEPARAAMAKVDQEDLLIRLVESAASKTARRLAASKLADIDQQRNKPDHNQLVTQSLQALADEAGQLLSSGDIDLAASRLAVIKDEWQKLDPAGKHPVFKVFDKTCSTLTAKFQEFQNLRQQEQAKGDCYARQQASLAKICITIEGLIGSTSHDAEEKQQQAVAEWASLLDNPDEKLTASATMTKRFKQACLAFAEKRVKIRGESEQVEGIGKSCAEVQVLTGAGKLEKAAVHLRTIEQQLATIQFKYFSKNASQKLVATLSADLERAKQDAHSANLARQLELCVAVEKLVVTENNQQPERQLQTLQQAWRKLVVMQDAEGRELAQRFRDGVTGFTAKRKAFQHEQDWQLWANLGLKEKLTARIIALDQQEDLATVVRVVKEAQIAWKAIGSVPPRKAQKLWDKFHSGCNRNFQRAEPYLQELKEQRAAAIVRRREICGLAAELARSTAWQKTAGDLKGLQEEWKALGYGSRREERELYQQFRTACNQFFERRQANYQSKESERQQHLLDKEKLCEEAEQLAAEPQADYGGKFRKLQAGWQKIGQVPRDQEKAIWQRFRTACDNYFNWVAEQQQQNLSCKEALCVQVESLLGATETAADPQEISGKLTELEQQWQEIGPVPRDQSAGIRQRFREPYDAFFKARQQQVAQEQQERQSNQTRKEELLAQAVELACQGTDKKIAAQLEKIQQEWVGIGTAPQEIDKKLADRFKDLCDAFFTGREQYFIELNKQYLANQKKKERLCLRLENILGVAAAPAAKGRSGALSLAEELKQAMEDNFMMAGRRNEKKSIAEEIKRLEQDWQQIGPVPLKQTRPLAARFQKSLDGYHKNRRA